MQALLFVFIQYLSKLVPVFESYNAGATLCVYIIFMIFKQTGAGVCVSVQ